MMIRYHCNCCGTDFSDEESFQCSIFPDVIMCPNCGVEREDETDDIIEEY